MGSRLARFHKVAALAEEPTPLRRFVAAAVAGVGALISTQLVLGIIWGAGWGAVPFATVAMAVAAAIAAWTTKRAMAIVFGILATIWLLLEGLILLIVCVAAALS
ncbi:hypothetical protein ACFB49_33220 [Sphingomonas sp. DBB INV C78]